MKRNIATSLIIGIIYSIIGVALWCAVGYFFDIRLGLVGLAIGFMVGKALSKSNSNGSPMFGIIAVIITTAAILLGEVSSLILLVSKEYDITIMETLTIIDYKVAFEIIVESSGAQSLVIYAISLFEAFKIGSSIGHTQDQDTEIEDIA
ncbi:MAG: hypothetical protein JEZ08_17215 [Clostridiales bacterium]|nr:hypothetical protein [Clostridiales bacterium]